MLVIIGGTGIYKLEGLEITQSHNIKTPFGDTSAEIKQGEIAGREILFLARHGEAHQLLPSEVNYRANIWALKSLGASQIVSLSAVGSLRQEVAPSDLVLAEQYFDFIKGNREKSFFGNGLVAHVSTAEPSCKSLASELKHLADGLDLVLHRHKTYACVDGPRLGTKAESLFLQRAGCDLVGMTNVPEAFLAREAQLCYCTIGIVTDFDCWQDDPSQHVSVEQVISRYGESLKKANSLLNAYLNASEHDCHHGCRHALTGAVLTPVSALGQKQKDLLEILQA